MHKKFVIVLGFDAWTFPKTCTSIPFCDSSGLPVTLCCTTSALQLEADGTNHNSCLTCEHFWGRPLAWLSVTPPVLSAKLCPVDQLFDIVMGSWCQNGNGTMTSTIEIPFSNTIPNYQTKLEEWQKGKEGDVFERRNLWRLPFDSLLESDTETFNGRMCAFKSCKFTCNGFRAF